LALLRHRHGHGVLGIDRHRRVAGRLTGHQPAYFLIRHAVFLAIGLIAAAVAVPGAPVNVWQQVRRRGCS
jgi:Na+/H+-dicarboxylate symporter